MSGPHTPRNQLIKKKEETKDVKRQEPPRLRTKKEMAEILREERQLSGAPLPPPLPFAKNSAGFIASTSKQNLKDIENRNNKENRKQASAVKRLFNP